MQKIFWEGREDKNSMSQRNCRIKVHFFSPADSDILVKFPLFSLSGKKKFWLYKFIFSVIIIFFNGKLSRFVKC